MMMLSSGSGGLTMRMMMMVGVDDDDVEDDERVHYLGNLLPRRLARSSNTFTRQAPTHSL